MSAERHAPMADGLLTVRCPDHDPEFRRGGPTVVRPMIQLLPISIGGPEYRCRPSDLDDPEVTVR